MKNIRIYWKINIILIIIILTVLTFIILFPINHTMNFIDKNEKANSIALARSLSLDNLDALLTTSYELIQENRKSLMGVQDLNIQYIILLDPIGLIMDYGCKGLTEDENKKYYAGGNVIFNDELSKEMLKIDKMTAIHYYDEENDVQIMEVANPLIIGKRKYGILRVGYNQHVSVQFVNEIVGMIVGILIVSLILGIIGSTLLSLNITKRINKLAKFTRQVITGDLSVGMETQGKDEIGILGNLIDKFVTEFAKIVNDTKHKISSVLSSGEMLNKVASEGNSFMKMLDVSITKTNEHVDSQLNSVNETGGAIENVIMSIGNVSQHYNNQSLLLNQEATSIDGITQSLDKVLETVNSTYDMSNTLSSMAIEGNNSVNNSIEAINEIASSSKQISEISMVISSIAEQTNLLAMNAAIEAAHAGEHGKGFSVVADEIRKLAETTSISTKDIITLIKNITSKIDKGVELSSLVKFSLNKMIEGIKKSSEQIINIKVAMEKQVVESKQVYGTTVNLVDMTKDINTLLEDQIKQENYVLQTLKQLESASVGVKGLSDEQRETTHQMTKNIDQLNDVVQYNSKVLSDLFYILQRFKHRDYNDNDGENNAITNYPTA